MMDILLETIRAVVLSGLVVFLWNSGRNRFEQFRKGWNLIITGFGLLLFGSILDISDNFESLNPFIVIGDTEVEAFLEKFVGFLGGFTLLAIGLFKWIPSVQDLSDLVDTRTRDFQKAREDAENANKAKSEFLASMSHELRTPLNAILGFAQMLQLGPKTSLSPAQNVHVESILEGGNHLLELVNDILDLARVESNQLDLSLEKVTANKVVADCVAMTNPLGERRGIKIVDQFSDGPSALLRTDRLRLKQILINLLSNAVKFNKNGGTITVDGQETNDGFLRISVMDTGVGIEKENYGSVFQMFHRLNADPMTTQEGTGIGLTVTKLLIERMAGRIGFESEENVGSTFWIELPLASNENVLIWTDTLRIGVDPIDKDHQVLISLLNRLIRSSVGDADLDKLIEELIDYTRYHFRREETIMEVCGYSGLEKHRGHHRKLASQVRDMADAWNKNRASDTLNKLVMFLQALVFSDILKADSDIASYTKGKDKKIREALKSLE